jgi:hypothetical protein
MKYILFIILVGISTMATAQGFKLKNGDFIFQEACPGNKENPIKEVTASIGDFQFTHVGMVYIDSNDSIFVLEATHPKVVLSTLEEYLYPKDKDCPPISVVGRLKSQYQSLIPQALEIGFTLIGKDYDYGFVLGNDMYYCSELVYEILKQANNGKEVFPLNIMTFKSKETGQTTQGWIDYFESKGLPVPEGELGINPGAMSQSGVMGIVHIF